MTNNQSTDLEKLIQQASQGDADAQYNLGVRYAKGREVPQDDVQAHMWYNLAAAQGDAEGTKNKDLVAKKNDPATNRPSSGTRSKLET